MKLRRQTRRLAADLSLQVKIVESLARSARAQGENRLLAIANFNLWMILFRRDFQFLFSDALLERDNLKKNFLVRQLAVSLCDFFDRVHPLTGTGIRPEIQSSDLPQAVKDDLDSVLRELGRLRNEHSQALNELRNLTAAHRDPDGLRQLEAIEAMDVDKVLAIAQDVCVGQGVLLAAWMLAARTWLQRSNFGVQPTASGRG